VIVGEKAWEYGWNVCGSEVFPRANSTLTQSALKTYHWEVPMRAVLWETFATIVIAAAIVAFAMLLPLACVTIQRRPTHEIRSEPLVLLKAREVASRAWERYGSTDLAIARISTDAR
jgi:hypothetical protein